ncbi:MAG: lysophospholipid acyltransferase family protein [Desulfamplus sp.]|nr:lysophospholipid acyltransferase family protein [Desulfamplus sp.]
MKSTIYGTPILSTVMHYMARFLLYSAGWQVKGIRPQVKKYILIAFPHTSNWDFYYTLLIAFSLKIKLYALAKKELFRPPFGPLMGWLGMIPVDRSQSNNKVAAIIETFNTHDALALAIPPSGTRGKVMVWKSGFYHIAHGAGIPIVMAYVDYGRKVGGLGPLITPSGDMAKDMVGILEFYRGITGKHPQKDVDAPFDPAGR